MHAGAVIGPVASYGQGSPAVGRDVVQRTWWLLPLAALALCADWPADAAPALPLALVALLTAYGLGITSKAINQRLPDIGILGVGNAAQMNLDLLSEDHGPRPTAPNLQDPANPDHHVHLLRGGGHAAWLRCFNRQVGFVVGRQSVQQLHVADNATLNNANATVEPGIEPVLD